MTSPAGVPERRVPSRSPVARRADDLSDAHPSGRVSGGAEPELQVRDAVRAGILDRLGDDAAHRLGCREERVRRRHVRQEGRERPRVAHA